MPPTAKFDSAAFPPDLLNQFEQPQQADCVIYAAADVERVRGCVLDPIGHAQERFDEIFDEKEIADLHAITKDPDGAALIRTDQKMRNPALIFGAVLVRTVNAAHSEHGGGEAETARVVEHVLIRRTFGAAVRTAEIEGTPLADSMLEHFSCFGRIAAAVDAKIDVGQRTVHFVCRCEQDDRGIPDLPDGLEKFQSSVRVHIEVMTRVHQAVCHGNLRRKMKYSKRVADSLLDGRAIADVRLLETHARAMFRNQPGKIRFRTVAREIVENQHSMAVGEQAIRQIRSDEARAAGNQDAVSAGASRKQRRGAVACR